MNAAGWENDLLFLCSMNTTSTAGSAGHIAQIAQDLAQQPGAYQSFLVLGPTQN